MVDLDVYRERLQQRLAQAQQIAAQAEQTLVQARQEILKIQGAFDLLQALQQDGEAKPESLDGGEMESVRTGAGKRRPPLFQGPPRDKADGQR